MPDGLPGMPPVLDAKDVYAADRANQLSPMVKDFPSRVYVPNTNSNTVSVIDPATYKVIKTIRVGVQPQHVVPSWDMKTLWVNNDRGNSLTPIDPRTGKAGKSVDVHDPYNLYFTPNGKYAIVMASLDRELVFRDAHTMEPRKTVPVSCYGVNHADFSPDGRSFIVSCEFSGELLKVDTEKMKVVAQQKLPFRGAMPQDVKISPDGKKYYVADMVADGVWVLDAAGLRQADAAAHRQGLPRPVRQPRLARDVHLQPGRGHDLRLRLRPGQADQEVAPAARRQPRHGRCLGRRQGPVAVGTLQLRGVRHRHALREAVGPHPGRQRPARPGRLPAAGPLLARPHRHLPLTGPQSGLTPSPGGPGPGRGTPARAGPHHDPWHRASGRGEQRLRAHRTVARRLERPQTAGVARCHLDPDGFAA